MQPARIAAVVSGVAKLLARRGASGAHSPSSAFGADFVAGPDGVRMGELPD